jgi:hypothetical protein
MPLVSEVSIADDGIGPALSFDPLKALALCHIRSSPEGNDVAMFVPASVRSRIQANPGVTENQHGPRCSPRYQRFESTFLQRRVRCELLPDPIGHHLPKAIPSPPRSRQCCRAQSFREIRSIGCP